MRPTQSWVKNLMKTYLFILILALCFTAWLNDTGAPPSPQPMGIDKVSANTYGANHQDNIIPNFTFTDKGRDSGYITKIDEKSSGNQAEFPIGLR